MSPGKDIKDLEVMMRKQLKKGLLCLLTAALMWGAMFSFSEADTYYATTVSGYRVTKVKKVKLRMTKGQKVVRYALRFLGNPYEYGGTSLTNGTDCSGFTMKIFRHFGKNIPRTSSSQRSAGKRVKSLRKAKPGDLICYDGHVAIYMGKNRVIHASNERDGIKITKNAAYRHIVSIRRIVR